MGKQAGHRYYPPHAMQAHVPGTGGCWPQLRQLAGQPHLNTAPDARPRHMLPSCLLTDVGEEEMVAAEEVAEAHEGEVSVRRTQHSLPTLDPRVTTPGLPQRRSPCNAVRQRQRSRQQQHSRSCVAAW